MERARGTIAHLRQRVGMLLPGCSDKWWEISKATVIAPLASEITEVIANEGAPYVARHLDVDERIALWESRKSPAGVARCLKTAVAAKVGQAGTRGMQQRASVQPVETHEGFEGDAHRRMP